jgi:hypothetical protein
MSDPAMSDWVERDYAELTGEIRAEIGLPIPPMGELDEFATRYLVAECAAWRYHRAMSVGPPLPQLATGWEAVLDELHRLHRLCVLGRQAPSQLRRGRRHDPSSKLTRRQRLSPRVRYLHNVHCSLVALERAADGAVRVVVAAALAHPRSTRAMSEVDGALTALAEAVDELAELTREIVD